MANTEYNFALFDDSAARELPRRDPIRKKADIKQFPSHLVSQTVRAKKSGKRNALLAMLVLSAISVGVLSLHGQARLTVLNEQIETANNELYVAQSKTAQDSLNLESKYTDKFVENYAKKHLEMVPSDSVRRETFSLSKGDKAEVIQQEEKSLFEKIADYF